jgi:hypothetical protein
MNGGNLNQLFRSLASSDLFPIVAASTNQSPFRLDMSIEGMRSQNFSIGVFVFMLIGVLVFSGIIYSVAFGRFAPKTMKPGERLMFGAIILGTVLAVVFGGLQLLGGNLF